MSLWLLGLVCQLLLNLSVVCCNSIIELSLFRLLMRNRLVFETKEFPGSSTSEFVIAKLMS